MKKIILYLLFLFIVYSGYQQFQAGWQENAEGIESTVQSASKAALGWFEDFSGKTEEVRENLKTKFDSAQDKYDQIKTDIEEATRTINEKREQLEKTLKEMEEAKKALDTLLATPEASEETPQ